MPSDFISNPDDFSKREDTELPFAVTPAWERGSKKRRGMFGGRPSRAAAEPRTFEPPEERSMDLTPTTLGDDARAYEARMDAPRLSDPDPEDSSFAVTPTYATRQGSSKSSTAPIAIMAGIIILGGAGAAAWYYTQPHGAGVAELTPGAATTTTTQAASTAPSATGPLPGEPQQLAQAATAPPAPAARSTTTTTTTTAPKAPAAKTTVTRSRTTARGASSATDETADVNATAPVPQPASAAAAPPAPPPMLNVPPATTTVAPPQAATPITPQVAPAPATVAPPPATPPTATPPT